MLPGERILSKLMDLGFSAAQSDMTDPEREEYLQQNLIGDSYSFHLPPQEDPQPASLIFENVGVTDGFDRVFVTLSFDGPDLDVPLTRFEEDIQFIYYEAIEDDMSPRVKDYLDDFPFAERVGPGDLSIVYVFRYGTLSRLRASMKSMAHVISFYHSPLHQTAQEMYQENRIEYKRGEYELPDKIEPSTRPDDPIEAYSEPFKWAGYVTRYFEFCAGEEYSAVNEDLAEEEGWHENPHSRKQVYRNRIQASQND